jgi:hypothetical protein
MKAKVNRKTENLKFEIGLTCYTPLFINNNVVQQHLKVENAV